MNFKSFFKTTNNRDILNDYPDGIVIIDFKKNIKFWNRRAQEIFGHTRREILDKPIAAIFESSIEDLYKTIGSINGTILKAKTRLGEEIYVDVTSFDVSDEVIISIRNASEKQRLVENLLEEYEQTKVLTHSRDSFITDLSGDLTSPLNSVIGFSRALLEGLGGELTEKQTKYLGIINANGKKLLDMLEEILDITTLDSNKKDFNFKNFDIIKTVEFVAETIKPLCDQKKLELIVDYSNLERRNCNCDEQALRKILLNILENALKFTETGSIQISLNHPELDFVAYQGIKVPVGYSEKSFIHFSIKDTGIGIQESELDSIFDEYRTLDKSIRQKYGGIGLSLAITRKILEKLDGVIWVESELLEGSDFHFIIPIERIRFSDLEN